MAEQAKPATSSLPAVVRLADRRPLKRTPLRRTTPLRRSGALARSSAPVRASVSVASEEQRRKVDGHRCLVCGRSDAVDAARRDALARRV